jgi:3-methyl-2-oxobutanoate hydroxymethyltransferase
MSDSTRKLSIPGLVAKKQAGERIAMLTCYDAMFARLLDAAGVDMLLVGDSLNEVIAGRSSTLSATIDQMIYHGTAVKRGASSALVVVDLPFLSYQVSVEDAIRNAGRVLAETDADAVKLEGGTHMAPTVRALVDRGIPVVGHLGFTPQSVRATGGARVQGRTDSARATMLEDARALEAAGAAAVVLELVPRQVAAEITAALAIPTIGIGAGPDCDGQVLVLHDMLGLNEGFNPKFLRRFVDLGEAVRAGAASYCDAVRDGSYPSDGESFH